MFSRFKPNLSTKSIRMGSIFIQKLNPITGVHDWIVQNENYDYHQEIARSSFADMLHDTERNQLYEKALKRAIEKTKAAGKKAKVLDIGTGTGLLSLMAAKHGADSIIACEAFQPMSQCARKIIAGNGFAHKIQVIAKRSTDLTVDSENGDLKERCNILVTEVFDTELIGEGALSTYAHARMYLLEENSLVVPHSATIYAQVIDSPLMHSWNSLHDIAKGKNVLVTIPESVRNCTGSAAVHDLQLTQVPSKLIRSLSEPLAVFQFDWSGKIPLEFERSVSLEFKAKQKGVAQGVFMWWDLKMDDECSIILSCAPRSDKPWRDHWMQAIYYFPHALPVNCGDDLKLVSSHDEYSLWFSLNESVKPSCACWLHTAFSRTRIGQLNNGKRTEQLLSVLERKVKADSVVLVLGDGFYASLAALKMGAKQIFYLESNGFSRRIMLDFVQSNKLSNSVRVFDSLNALKSQLQLESVRIDLIVGEPYFIGSILPWDNLYFAHLVADLRSCCADDVQIYPQKGVVCAAAVCFDDLHKIRAPLGVCEGFAMEAFDELIEASSCISDELVEAQPLWEYPGVALSESLEVACIDLRRNDVLVEEIGEIYIKSKCNGVAIWLDWYFDDTIISGGPVAPIRVGERIQWDRDSRQGVCLFGSTKENIVDYAFKFDCKLGKVGLVCS